MTRAGSPSSGKSSLSRHRYKSQGWIMVTSTAAFQSMIHPGSPLLIRW
jgi:hypothetical protein